MIPRTVSALHPLLAAGSQRLMMILYLREHFASEGFNLLLQVGRNNYLINSFEATEFHRFQ